jgi:DNA-binding transcriptional LysR family regulator
LERSAWLAQPHIIVGTAEGTGLVARTLERIGDRRRVGFVAPSFMSALHAVSATDWFFAAPRELVTKLAHDLDIVAVEPPAALPAVRVVTVFHERMQSDPGHHFFRDLVAAVVQGAISAAK